MCSTSMKKAKTLRGPKEAYIEAEKARKANNGSQ
jgi:hypothetical protein